MGSIILPTVQELDNVFKHAQKSLGYYAPVAKSAIYSDAKLKTLVGFTLHPDMVTIYHKASPFPPQMVDFSESSPVVVSAEQMRIIWGTTEVQAVPLEVTGAVYNKLALAASECYLAHKVVKYGLVAPLVNVMKKVQADPSAATSQLVEAMSSFLEKACSKFAKLSDKMVVPVRAGSLVAFGEKLQVPKALFQASIRRLCAGCPKNILFVFNYFRCFPSILGGIRPHLRPWEKLHV
jgi:hypothetical protein